LGDRRAAAEVALEFPDVTWDKMLVDAMTMRMTLKPETLDTIVATNLHADVLSDLAAGISAEIVYVDGGFSQVGMVTSNS
jgi:tartrate dehydrogenase/decarboxylase/D-malate dehydrogenase